MLSRSFSLSLLQEYYTEQNGDQPSYTNLGAPNEKDKFLTSDKRGIFKCKFKGSVGALYLPGNVVHSSVLLLGEGLQ